MSRSECQRRLQPKFDAGGLGRAWQMQPSEMCAGGVAGEDSCRGEGGSPLVCLDKVSRSICILVPVWPQPIIMSDFPLVTET